MSQTQILAQNATQLSVSGNSEAEYDFVQSAKIAAERKAKGMTRERWFLSRPKLISAICADYRARFASVYGKAERLPSSIFEKIEKAVDSVIASQLSQVNAQNVISLRRSFSHKSNQYKFVERVTATGENELALKEQLLGCHLAIGSVQRRLDDMSKSGRLTEDLRKDLQAQMMKLQLTENFIKGEIQHQEKAVASPEQK